MVLAVKGSNVEQWTVILEIFQTKNALSLLQGLNGLSMTKVIRLKDKQKNGKKCGFHTTNTTYFSSQASNRARLILTTFVGNVVAYFNNTLIFFLSPA